MKAAVKWLTLAIALSVGMSNVAWTKEGNEEIAVSLSTLLRSARAVISDKQKHINNPEIGDKGLSADVVVGIAKANYKKATGKDIDAIDPASLHGQLIAAAVPSSADFSTRLQCSES
jgi:threonine aldolase